MKGRRKELKAELAASAARFPIDRLVEIDRSQWPFERPWLEQVFASRNFVVQVYSEPELVYRLSVTKNALGFGQRTFADGISWDELQWIKNQLYPGAMAVEIYPPQGREVNDCNMRHLWVLPQPLYMGWNQEAP
jgi:hypothetical protein